MTLSEWINNIRWKYFTNNKSGLIFKELTKKFRIVYKMTENKQLELENKRLKEIIEDKIGTILKQKRKIKELETRNQRQYDRLKELTELMYERQWEKLENMVDDWEKADELLEQEWGTYCENK